MKSSLKILYHIPSLETVYAARFIYEGYKDAFTDLGHTFRPLTSSMNLADTLKEYQPDIFISSLNRYALKFLDLDLIKNYRKKNMVFFTQIRPWKKQTVQYEAAGLEDDTFLRGLIKQGLAGDVFFHWIEQEDPVMQGFSKSTGYPFHTILLAANKNQYFYEKDPKYNADISYVGSLLPDKKVFIKKHIMPLFKQYNVKVYGSDWTKYDTFLGYVQKAGQFFNIEPLKKVRKIKLPLDDERKVYSSSVISLNIHEEHQRLFGSDFNERTLKIPASGGFEISDYVSAIRKYFTADEIVMAKDTNDWFDKIKYYIDNPEKRLSIIKKGQTKVLKHHTYHNRVEQIISIYNQQRKS